MRWRSAVASRFSLPPQSAATESTDASPGRAPRYFWPSARPRRSVSWCPSEFRRPGTVRRRRQRLRRMAASWAGERRSGSYYSMRVLALREGRPGQGPWCRSVLRMGGRSTTVWRAIGARRSCGASPCGQAMLSNMTCLFGGRPCHARHTGAAIADLDSGFRPTPAAHVPRVGLGRLPLPGAECGGAETVITALLSRRSRRTGACESRSRGSSPPLSRPRWDARRR